MGGKIKIKRHVLRKCTTDSPQKITRTHGEGMYQSCPKNCEILNFGILTMFFVVVKLGPYVSKSFKRHLF